MLVTYAPELTSNITTMVVGGSDGRRGSGGGEGRESAQVRDSFSPARESYRCGIFILHEKKLLGTFL